MSSLQHTQSHSPYPVGLQHQGVPQGHMAGMPQIRVSKVNQVRVCLNRCIWEFLWARRPSSHPSWCYDGWNATWGWGPNAHALQHLNPNQQAQCSNSNSK
ncbi:hypothetical protein EYC84_006022 [Monilinia fructicola]|uniref:Uncharacterized protein n=1 Tax=Monilinia fructicola TaxID=38448 RepID=A0A5M9K1C3_MONFR|nr:hypothetical protein EYC84_006022 [Monilinia fructicola]